MAVAVAEKVDCCPGGFGPVGKWEEVLENNRQYVKVAFPPLGGGQVEVSAAVTNNIWCDDRPNRLTPCKLFELYDGSADTVVKPGVESQFSGVCKVCQKAATIFIRPLEPSEFTI